MNKSKYRRLIIVKESGAHYPHHLGCVPAAFPDKTALPVIMEVGDIVQGRFFYSQLVFYPVDPV